MKLKKPQSIYISLFIIWSIVQGVLLFQYGIITTGEAPKYMDEAVYFTQNHHFSEPKYLFYSLYIFLHMISNAIGTGTTGVYIVQVVLNLIATWCFYRLACQITKHQTTAILATLLLISCFPWQKWTTHLYTESVFLSLFLIFSWLLFKPHKKTSGYVLMAMLFVLLLLARPTGLLLILIVLFLVLRRLWLQQKKVIALGITAAVVTVFIIILNYAMRGEGEFDFLKPFIEEHLICGVPTAHNRQLVLPRDGNSIQGLLSYIGHHPMHFLELAVKKTLIYFGMVRSYYSTFHNTCIILFFYPLYLFAIVGLIRLQKLHATYNLFWITAVFIFTASVALTCDDWHNRFMMPVIPFIILAAATGIKQVASRFAQKTTGSI